MNRFSKKQIVQFEPVVRQTVDYLCQKIARYEKSDRVLTISNAWSCYAGDVITEYAFGLCYNHLDSDDFEGSFHDIFMAVSEFGHVTLQFP
jgi:Cytochrome P450